MENENEKKFYTAVENGKLCYRMVDPKSKEMFGSKTNHYYSYRKSKSCHLVFIDKQLVALNPDVDRSYGYRYNYKIVPDKDAKYKKHWWVNSSTLIGPDIYDIKDKHI